MKGLAFLVVSLACILFWVVYICAEETEGDVAMQTVSGLVDDFEGTITGGPEGTVDFGAGSGSSVNVSASTDIKYEGKQALKVEYDAVTGGYMWIARGYDLDVKGADVWRTNPKDINWKDYNAFSFYMYGQNSKGNIAFDIKDSGNEMFRFMVQDNFTGWKQIICPFAQFFSRSDWQPNNANKNDTIDFPLKSFQFEPLPESKGILYFDDVELVKTS